MNRFKYYTPDGVSDILPEDCYTKKDLEGKLRQLFLLNGYQEVETPTLEFYDVFSAGNSFVPQEEMFKFFDNNGRILVLRYDGTLPVARVISTLMKDEDMPVLLFYIGNMFRYNETGGGKQREFTQAGIEILGPNTPESDAQAIEVAIRSALELGISDLQVSLGNVEFFKGLVEEWGLDVDKSLILQKLIENKEILGIKDFCKSTSLPENANELLDKMLYSAGGLELIDEMFSLINNEKARAALDNLKRVMCILKDCGMDKYISFDLGMLQSLNYYTGVIFKGFTYGLGFPIFSGGRYDKVADQFGRPANATGFSLGINMVMKALRRKGLVSKGAGPQLLVGYDSSSKDAQRKAFDYAQGQRAKGVKVMTDCAGLNEEGIKGLAESKGIGEYKFFA